MRNKFENIDKTSHRPQCKQWKEYTVSNVVLLSSLGSAQKAQFLARAFGQKARLVSAHSIFQKACFRYFWKSELFGKIIMMRLQHLPNLVPYVIYSAFQKTRFFGRL